MLELTFMVGENRTRNTSRRLSHPSLFNEIMILIKGPREFSRRARELDFAVLKAQEMRNIILFFFPVVIQCIEPEAKERRLWLLLAFMIRSCVLPSAEYEKIDKSEIVNASKQFYLLFEQLFSSKNCTYSIHVVGTHLLEMRALGPLTENSAFIFENFYGEMRRAFTPGTNSTLKQIMQKTYLKRSFSYHKCEKSIFYSAKDTALERNSLVYIFDGEQYLMYQIIEIENNNTFICNVQGRLEIEFNEATELNWSKVGVFREGATGNEEVRIEKHQVHGKVLKVCSLLITCPINVLNEK